MKAILEFNLDEEQEEFDTMLKAKDYAAALWDLRSLVKLFEDKFDVLENESARQLFEEFRVAFWEAISDRSIEL